MSAQILVIGATGNQGGSVARALLHAGRSVRALTRRPGGAAARAFELEGATLVAGDITDLHLPTRACDGVSGIFSVQNFWQADADLEVAWGRHVLTAAQRSGTPHVIYSSGWGAEKSQAVRAIDGKALLEEALRTSGLPYTVLRPGLFMDDLLGASLPFSAGVAHLLNPLRPNVGRFFLRILCTVRPRAVPICRWTYNLSRKDRLCFQITLAKRCFQIPISVSRPSQWH